MAIFGRDLLEDDGQFGGFALLTATGGSKPFECAGEEEESLAAIRLSLEVVLLLLGEHRVDAYEAVEGVGVAHGAQPTLELVRRFGLRTAPLSVGDAAAIARTAQVAGLPRLVAHSRLDPGFGEPDRSGALNVRVPVTAIVACVAVLTAALLGFDAVAMDDERGASSGDVGWEGIQVNQFSMGVATERFLRAAVGEQSRGVDVFSVGARPPSSPRAFVRLDRFSLGDGSGLGRTPRSTGRA